MSDHYEVEADGLLVKFTVVHSSAGPGVASHTEPDIQSARILDVEEFAGAHGADAVAEFNSDPVDWAHGKYAQEDGGVWLLNQVGA